MFFPNNKSNRHPTPERKPISKEAKRRAIIILVLAVVFTVIYYGSMELGFGMYIMTAYMIIFAALLMTYICYNRAFINKNVTADMLPDAWDAEKKEAFIRKNAERAEKSKWMLVLIVPLAFVFLAEAVYLFLWTDNLEKFFIK